MDLLAGSVSLALSGGNVRFLYLDEEFPFPMNSGKRIRTYSLVRRLAASCHVDYLAFGEVFGESERAFRDHGINPIPAEAFLPGKSGLTYYARLLRNLFESRPYSVRSHHDRRFARKFDEALRNEKYDALICEWTPYAQYVERIIDIPRIVCTHNVEHVIWERMRIHEDNLLKKAYIETQARKWRDFERSVFRWIDGATAVSEEDAAVIRGINPQLPVAVVENGVDLDLYVNEAQDEDPSTILFVGAMDWRPNQDAVRHFADHIFPRIKLRVPEARFTIVGRTPPEGIRALSRQPGIAVTGTVPDVRPYLERSTVVVVPLRIGGGSRLKIIEALAMKKAVVSSTVGAEGLVVKNGEHLIVADDPEEFAAATVALLKSRERRRELGARGRRLVEDRYGWDALAAKLLDHVSSIVADHAGRPVRREHD